jgi:hypothetical protein
MDSKKVSISSTRHVVQRGAGDDEDGTVDEEGKCEEGQRQLDDGILQTAPDGMQGWTVFDLAISAAQRDCRFDIAGSDIEFLQAGLDHAAAKEE